MDHATDQPPAPGGNGFPPARAPWSVAQGLVIFVLFVLIPIAVAGLAHLVFGAFGGSDAFGMQISQHGFQMAGGAVVLIVIYVFLRAKAGSSREASDLIGLSVADPRRFVVASLVPLGVGVVALVAWALAQWVLNLPRSGVAMGLKSPSWRCFHASPHWKTKTSAKSLPRSFENAASRSWSAPRWKASRF